MSRARGAAPKGVPERPASATHAGVAWSGAICMLLAVTVLNFWPPVHQIAHLALIVMAATALGVFVPDLLWQKVQRRTLVAASAGSAARVLTKLLGLLGSVGFIALLYWLFPEYASHGFYANYWAALRVVLPLWALVSLPYIYWVDRRLREPRDALWQMGRLLTLQWDDVSGRVIGQHLLGWLVKGYYLPLMFTYFCDNLDKLLHYNLNQLHGFRGVYDWAYFTLYFIDVALAHRYPYPLDRAERVRLDCGAGVLRTVLVADRRAVHRLRQWPRLGSVARRLARALCALGLADPADAGHLRLVHDCLRRPVLEPDTSRHHHQWTLSLQQASGVSGQRPVVVADLDAVHAQRESRAIAALLPAAVHAQWYLLSARQDRGAPPGARSGLPAVRALDRTARAAARSRSPSGHRRSGALAAELCGLLLTGPLHARPLALIGALIAQPDRARRSGQSDAGPPEGAQDFAVDLIERATQVAPGSVLDKEAHLEQQRRFAQQFEQAINETRAVIGGNRLLDQHRHLVDQRRRRIVDQGQVEQRAPLAGAAEIAHPALEQIGIGDDDLLAGHTAQPRALDADLLDRALEAVDPQRVADAKGLVERDRQRSEQIPEYGLHRQRNGDAADAQARDQRPDVDAEVLEREQRYDDPDDQPQREQHDVDRAGQPRIAGACLLALQSEARGRARPDAYLQPAARNDGDFEATIDRLGQCQDTIGHVQRHDPEHDPAGTLDEIGEQRHRRGQIAVGVVTAPRAQIAAQ